MQHARYHRQLDDIGERPALELAAALGEVAHSVSSTLELPDILERVFDLLESFIPFDSSSIMLIRGEVLVVAAGRGFPPELRVEETELPVYPGVTHYPVIAEGRAIVVEDVASHPGWQKVPGHQLVRSWIGVPLLVEGRAIGMLTIDKWEPLVYNQHHAALAQAFANHVAVAIHNAQLYAESQRAYAELRRTQAELLRHEKLRVLGELASGIAHDFNNVLTSILGNIQLLIQLSDPSTLPAELRVIERAAQDGAAIVRRLQEFARPAPSGMLAPVDLRSVVEMALDLTRPRWQGQPAPHAPVVRIVTELMPAVTAPIEVAELRQVLVNLIINALDAMPAGGTLRLETGSRDGEAFVLVQDTGIGMTADVLERIFDPFFTTKGQNGSGMGLATSQAFAARQGGRITVESAPGAGTTFTVYLPIGDGVAAPEPQPHRTTGAASHSILVVDDEIEIRDLIRRALQAHGYCVTLAASVNEAYTAFEHQSYDLVMTDLSMPGMNGWELIRRVRLRDQQVALVLMSGWGEQVASAIAQDQLIDYTLAKPFTLAELYRSVSTAIEVAGRRHPPAALV